MSNFTFVNTQVPVEMDTRLRQIAAENRVSRSDVVRIALNEFISRYQVVGVTTLPHPPDAEPVPVMLVAPTPEA